MNQRDKLIQLNSSPYFTIGTISRVLDQDGESLYSNIKRWVKEGEIIRLRRGLYVTRDYFNTLDRMERDQYYEYIAGILMPESYLSGAYVLQKYEILTERVYAITSVTIKKTKDYKNDFGRFMYAKIKEDLFLGFTVRSTGLFVVAEASRMKALFDFLYFRLYRKPVLTSDLIASFRLNLEGISREELNEFKKYCWLAGAKKYLVLPKMVESLKNGY